MAESSSFLVTIPGEWALDEYATTKRKFPSIQDYVRELIRRDIEAYEKEHGTTEPAPAPTNGKKGK